MGIFYNAKKKDIVINYEPTNYKTNYYTDRFEKAEIEFSQELKYVRDRDGDERPRMVWTSKIYEVRPSGERKLYRSDSFTRRAFYDDEEGQWRVAYGEEGREEYEDWRDSQNRQRKYKEDRLKEDKDLNKQNRKFNADNAKKNAANQAINNKYDQVRNNARAAQGGDYVDVRKTIRKIGLKNGESVFKDYYRDNKLQKWDTNLGTKPPYGNFDAKYYGDTYATPRNTWNSAVANDNIDVTERYGNPNSYYLYHYTTRGKKAGNRGNPAEATAQADAYVEKKPTDAELQQVRDKQLGVDIDTTSDRLLNIKYIGDEWEKAKNGDPYWKQQAKEKYLDPKNKDEFIALFRLSERPEDKQVSLVNNINVNYGISDLEDAINEATGEKIIVDTKKFGALAQDVLKESIEQVKIAKGKEAEIDFLSGFGGFSEIMNINDTLTNSLLGDSGIGGLMAFTGDKEKFEESFEKSISGISGVNKNLASYNWQSWFDDTLTKRYDEALELGLTKEEAEEQIKIEKEFAESFVNDYLNPRFNESKSMDEFIEYIDVRQEEKNPFQTQDMLDAITTTAGLKADEFIRQVQKEQDRYFDSNFYFNPTGNAAEVDKYAAQKEDVSNAWAAAKKNPNAYIDPKNKSLGTWAQQAYRFGLDLNNKDNFARMHFQILGQGKGYDAAKDILTAGAVKDYIYDKILPTLEDEVLESGTVFGEFILPEEFADDVLEGLDPNDSTTWEETLEKLGLEDFKGDIEELKGYIVETLQTGSAQKIREQLKYLNEKRKKPTQKNLGVTYIEREEDYDPEKLKGETELYKVFQNAGFQGTEDEFYENFMPDLNREDQKLLSSAGSNESFKFDFGDYSDPFESLASIESFFPEDEKDGEAGSKKKSGGLFDLSLDIDDTSDYKSNKAQSILGEFTSGFSFS